MMRAAIYARNSSVNQREPSIEDQVRLCRERAEAGDNHVVEVYSDCRRHPGVVARNA